LASVTGYVSCADRPEGDVSSDDFFLDINLLLGIPSPILDDDGGGWQAYEIPEFSDVAEGSPNCTGTYKDSNVAPFMWAWGFWGGVMPFVAHSSAGYDPMAPGKSSAWLAEFGVSRNGGTLPAFAFSMMPKMLTLVSPAGIGASFPFTILGKDMNVETRVSDMVNMEVSMATTANLLVGVGANWFLRYYSYAIYTLHLYPGAWCLIYTFFIVLPVAAYRFKLDTKLAG